MFFDKKIWAAKSDNPVFLLPEMANRHGLITGATGTGKTVTVKVLAESFSDAGVPVFLSDIKGDLSGMSASGVDSDNMRERIEKFNLADTGFIFKGYPTTYWDVFGKKGTPVRATVSEMGPMLLSRLMGLSEVQEGVMSIIFRIADDQNLLILDLKDLRSVVQAVGDHAADYRTSYGNITTSSIGAIQRALFKLEDQGADLFFGEPALDINDWIRTDSEGRGMINVLNCEKLFQQSDLYATVLLWMLSELYEILPEAGDLDKPKIVFFFDEAHLLFDIESKELMSKVEQVVRLIRSKGVGIYFISQSPTDIPNAVLGQLGNKIQHALRAYTPADQKAIKAAAQSFVVNPAFKTEEVITQLGKGEALVSFLDSEGIPSMVQRSFILPPQSLMGVLDATRFQKAIETQDMHGKYKNMIDRESAYELLNGITPAAISGKSVSNVIDVPENGWQCKCGQVNTGNFCTGCGLPKVSAAVPPGSVIQEPQTQANRTPSNGPNLLDSVQNKQQQQQQTVTLTAEQFEKLKKEAVQEAKAELKKESKSSSRKSSASSRTLNSVSRAAGTTLARGLLKTLLK